MEHVPYASAVIAPHVLRYLRMVAAERGHDLDPALRRAGLDGEALDGVELRVSYRQGSQVIRETLRALGDPLLGLAVGGRQHAASWGVLGLALMTAPSVRAGVQLGLGFQQAAGSLLDYAAEPAPGDGLAIVATMRDPAADEAVECFLVDEAFASITAVIADCLGEPFAPAAVQVRHRAPADAGAYREVFAVRPRFGLARNRFVVDGEHLGRRPIRADPWVFAQAAAAIDADAPAHRERRELVAALEVDVARALPNVPTLADQAGRLLTSERTLRRRLAGSGTTYQAIVDGVRATAALRLIGAAPLSLDEVAARVGYSDSRTLRRAVRRWTGDRPSALRAGDGQAR